MRYTFTRCPSRIVIVGSRFRNRFITCIVACDVASPTPPAMTTVRSSPSPRPRPALPRYCDKPADQADGGSGAERRQVVLIDVVRRPASPIWLSPRNWSRRYVRPSGISRR